MLSFRLVTTVSLIALTLASCARDPNVAKKKYLDSGNRYMDRGRLKEAAIQYQNAVKIDPKYGPAHYKLAKVYMAVKPPQIGAAIEQFRRAKELLKGNQAYQEEYKDSMVQLSDLYLFFLPKDKELLDDVQTYCDELFKKDPNSFDGFRLSGDLSYTRASQEVAPTAAEALRNTAMGFYRKADAVRPGDPAVSMQIGAILFAEKQYADAEPYFRKAIDKDKSSYQGYMNLYRDYMIEQKTGEAEALLKEAIQNNPKTPVYMERLAYHYGALGRRDDMLNVLAQIKAHAQDFDAVYQIVGNFYLRAGDTDSALREYREGIVKDPKHKSNYQKAIIEVLLRQGKRAEATEVNNQILKDNPKDPDAKSLAATFLLDQGDVNAALTQLQAVVTSSPDNAVARFQLGRAYLASNRPDAREAARQEFQRAINLRPDYLSPRLGLAELQVGHAEYQAALDSVQEIMKRDPNNVNAKIVQSQAYLGQKKFEDSDTLLAGMLKSNPSSPDVFFQAGVNALAQGKPKDAEAAFMRAYQLNPTNGKSLMGVVRADIQQGQPDKAMALLDSESKKAPNRLDIPLLMGTTAQQEGKYAESLTYFNKVLNGLDQKSKTRADLYLDIAQTYRLQGNLDSSISYIQKAREILPENPTVLSDLGLVTDLAGRRTEARQAYEACLKVDPNNALILNNLAYLMAETNADLDVALNDAQKAKGLQPNLPEISDTYGWILLKKGLADQAVTVFQDLVNRVPGNSTYRFHLAKAYQEKGDAAKATAELREALKHSPPRQEQQDIQDMLSRLGAK
jgi:tetratricopeptide (TPR) repeat protein